MALVDDEHVPAVRRFNRFHTRWVGALDETLLASGFTLAETRLIYEIATGTDVAAADLCQTLRLDPGYLSRVLSGLRRRGVVTGAPDPANAKRTILRLTGAGQRKFARLDAASASEVRQRLAPLSAAECSRLVAAMGRIEHLLGERNVEAGITLRDPVPGDMGFITHRQAVLYAGEYGWDWTFEALVSQIVGDFITSHDASCERCWVAEHCGKIAGSVFVVRHDQATAKLRLLYVEPETRGSGLGRRLVRECMTFAREKGYRRLVLWTNSNLEAAIHIYRTEGFILTGEEPHHSFGHDLVGQTWVLQL